MISPIYLHRLANWLWRHKVRGIPGILMRLNYFITGCDIAPQVKVGRDVHFQHYGSGVVIHPNVEIGDNVWIMPQVVLGQNIRDGVPLPGSTVFIHIEHGVMLGAGVKVIASGVLRIGEGASVGANAVVLDSIPAGAIAVGVPARLVRTRPPKEQEPQSFNSSSLD